MNQPRWGGKSPLRFLLKGGQVLAGSLLPAPDGGSGLEQGFRELVAEKTQGAIRAEYTREPWNGGLEGPGGAAAFADRLLQEQIDVLVLSPEAVAAGNTPAADFRGQLYGVVRAIKERSGPHVIALNLSSIVPGDLTHNYYGMEDTLAVRIAGLNLALLECSIDEGISIVDADRIAAEEGGLEQVEGPLVYSRRLQEAVCAEFVRVLEDIGFFEKRPLVKQVGNRRRRHAS